jgi:hypothetical protein
MHKFFGIAAVVLAFATPANAQQATQPAPAQTEPVQAQTASGTYAAQSKRFNTALRFCKGMRDSTPENQDKSARKLESLSEKDFEEHMWDCYNPAWREVGKEKIIEAARQRKEASSANAQAANYGYRPDNARQQGGSQGFGNVATDSRKGLQAMGGNTHLCEPPRQLHRTSRCQSMGNGVQRCQWACY